MNSLSNLWLRAGGLCLLFLAVAWGLHAFDHKTTTKIHRSLTLMPHSLGQWQVVQKQNLENSVAKVLQVDDYILRTYQGPENLRMNVYVSFFSYLDRNKGFHSPLNCMPGSGWGIAATDTVTVGQDHKTWTVNRTLLQKGDTTQVMLYWYQGRGRVMHNEYMERIYRVLDSILLGRTDGAFVRLICQDTSAGVQTATRELTSAAAKLIPLLWDYLPDREAAT